MGRRELTGKTSWDDSYAVIAYTSDALGLAGEDGDKAVGALTLAVEKLLKQWEALDSERRAARRTVGRANALVRRRDVQADTAVTELHNDTLGHVKLDRDSALFKRLFPNPLSSVVRLALESELSELRAIATKLAEDETPSGIKKAHQKRITDVIDRGDLAVRAREEAFAAAGRTSARVGAWRDDANAVLLGVEGALKQVASEHKLGTEWVNAFFPAPDRSKKKGKGSKTKAPAAPA